MTVIICPNAGTRSGSSRGKRDPVWEHGLPIENNSHGVICLHCGKEINGGGITRLKAHLLSNDPSKNVKKCEKVPKEVKEELKRLVEKKNKKRKQL